jgi:hypothetical protein
MAALDSDKVRSALRDKMGCEEGRSGDHIRYILHDGDKILCRTKISHGPKHAIGATLIAKMAQQFGLGSSANFVAMVQCTKSTLECLEIIRRAAN